MRRGRRDGKKSANRASLVRRLGAEGFSIARPSARVLSQGRPALRRPWTCRKVTVLPCVPSFLSQFSQAPSRSPRADIPRIPSPSRCPPCAEDRGSVRLRKGPRSSRRRSSTTRSTSGRAGAWCGRSTRTSGARRLLPARPRRRLGAVPLHGERRVRPSPSCRTRIGPTYLALARGEFPDDHHGERAREDKYLELYGIMPTLVAPARRASSARRRSRARATLDLDAARARSTGFIAYDDNERRARNAAPLRRRSSAQVTRVDRARSASPIAAQLDRERALDRDKGVVTRLPRARARLRARSRAAQERLECEGYFEGKGAHRARARSTGPRTRRSPSSSGATASTAGASSARDTLAALRTPPMELERDDRGARADRARDARRRRHRGRQRRRSRRTRRARSAAPTARAPGAEPRGRSCATHSSRRSASQTPESTLAFLEWLGELAPTGAHRRVRRGPRCPSTTRRHGALGRDRSRRRLVRVPVRRARAASARSRSSVVRASRSSSSYHDQRIPLARFGTTIGGWRSEHIEGAT